jgi:hypothetical protein
MPCIFGSARATPMRHSENAGNLVATFHHLTNPHPHKPQADLSRFFVVTTIFNADRYKRIYELYWEFKEMCDAAQVKLITVEQAFGDRQFMVTEPNNEMHVQVRTADQLWHKENQINLGAERATKLGAREIAWVDADCKPTGTPRDWFESTWHALQHWEFVQMLEYLIDLDLNGNALGPPQMAFMANYIKAGCPDIEEFTRLSKGTASYPYKGKFPGLSGLAWAANVETGLNRVGRLMDYSILGANDWYTAHALVGMLTSTTVNVPPGPYLDKMLHFQTLCERWIKRDVGYVRGTLLHSFHSMKSNRQYSTRGRILSENGYNPETDIKMDTQGLWQLETWEPRQIRMRDQIRAYFRSRNADSTTGGEGSPL